MGHRPQLTAAVHRLVALDRHARSPTGPLTAIQIEALTAIARDAVADRVSAPHAIQALARGTAAEVSIPLLSRIVSDNAAATPARVAAARELGLLGTPEAEQALRHRIGVEQPQVLQDVLWGLGALGGLAALRALARLAMPRDAAARRQLTWARALIAHRHAAEGDYLPAVEGQVRHADRIADAATLTVVLQTAAATARDRARLTGSLYGIELAPRAIGLICGGTESTVFLNRELDLSAMAARLPQRPWIAALVARWHLQRRAAIVKQVILATPTRDGVRLEIVRRDGERLYTGRAEVSDGGVRFTIADIDRQATTATNITGRLTPRGVDLERVVIARQRFAARAAM
jgi:HEAT repeat protein